MGEVEAKAGERVSWGPVRGRARGRPLLVSAGACGGTA